MRHGRTRNQGRPAGGGFDACDGRRDRHDSAAFNAVNRGKLGIVLDLQQPPGRAALSRLGPSADIFIENYRPGVMARLGLDYRSLAAKNRRLIYASISGYGATGPSASKGGFDLVAQGVSRIMSVTGEPASAGESGTADYDLGAGPFALAAIRAALHWRASSERGQHIDTSLVEAGVALSVGKPLSTSRGGCRSRWARHTA